jgi:hypothetical protein
VKALRFLLALTLCWLACASESRAYMVENRVWEKSGYQPVSTGENELQTLERYQENCPAYGELASGQQVWTKFDPEGLFAGTPLDAGEWFGAVFSGAGSGAVGYTKGLVESPYTLGKGVVSGYQQIGGLAGDVMTGNSGAKAIMQNPGTALKATVSAAGDTVKQIGQSFTTPEGIGNNVGGFVLLGGAAAKPPGLAAVDDATAANAAAKAPPPPPSASATVTRYMSKAEADTAAQTGQIPNTNAALEPRPTHVTTDAPLDSASQAQKVYELPETPTHRATVPAEQAGPLGPAKTGPTTSGGGSQNATSNPIPVKPDQITPLGP